MSILQHVVRAVFKKMSWESSSVVLVSLAIQLLSRGSGSGSMNEKEVVERKNKGFQKQVCVERVGLVITTVLCLIPVFS